jgi:hypothetical protein
MTDIEKKALALVNEVCRERSRPEWRYLERPKDTAAEALCRAIEQHEAFKLEVSDAVEDVDIRLAGDGFLKTGETRQMLAPFIIAKPDNIAAGLALAVEDTLELVVGDEDVNRLRAALAARGLKIVEVGHD